LEFRNLIGIGKSRAEDSSWSGPPFGRVILLLNTQMYSRTIGEHDGFERTEDTLVEDCVNIMDHNVILVRFHARRPESVFLHGFLRGDAQNTRGAREW
jgi:hypothetical protein